MENSQKKFLDKVVDIILGYTKIDYSDWYINYYRCYRCGTEWEDEWSCMCDDRCPNCEWASEPYNSELTDKKIPFISINDWEMEGLYLPMSPDRYFKEFCVKNFGLGMSEIDYVWSELKHKIIDMVDKKKII